MSKINLKILQILQKDAKTSVQEVADQVGLSATPVWRRIKALKEIKNQMQLPLF